MRAVFLIAMAMMVAEVLGISYEDVRPVVGDTTAIGFSASTGGSRVTSRIIPAIEDPISEARRTGQAPTGEQDGN